MGYKLHEYHFQDILGQGGFGITYLAHDTQLDALVAIKEYFPNQLAVRNSDDYTVQPKSPEDAENFTWGLERFIKEARTLASFNHPNIVRVRRFFKAHNTAYIVMDYEEGCSLYKRLKKGEVAEAELLQMLLPLLEGLKTLHQAGYLHRDIKPGNIYLRAKDKSPVLIDFGMARYEVGDRTHSMNTIVSPGYSPFELYQSGNKQGVWTDIYALGAVLYRTIGGAKPVEATKRVNASVYEEEDPLIPAEKVGSGRYSKRLLKAIDWALKVRESDRPENVIAWTKAIFPPFEPSRSGPSNPIKWAALFVLAVVLAFYMGTQKTTETTNCDTSDENSFRDPLRDGGCGPEMVVIPAGYFRIGDIQGGGDDDEQPVHWISLDSFAMCRYEVTFAEYDRFAEATKRVKPDDLMWGRCNRPVINVSWDDAMAYMDWLTVQTGKSYSLPSESQWEYAARAGRATKYWWGNTASHEYANYGAERCCDGLMKGKDIWFFTSPVGSLKDNPFGLFDTVGNVWEWVADPYHNNYKGAPKDGSVWNEEEGKRVIRGCSWLDKSKDCRTANRLRFLSNSRLNNIGFRCSSVVRSIK
ncbi:MAG: bifunctional serine/threonine-protein kinase/formylglycine-generating enzyme family protein [Pseudomonadota bacterium]